MTSGDAAFLQPGGSGFPAAIQPSQPKLLWRRRRIAAERLSRNRSPSFTRMVAKERPRAVYVTAI
jgi:hypothetical protein